MSDIYEYGGNNAPYESGDIGNPSSELEPLKFEDNIDITDEPKVEEKREASSQPLVFEDINHAIGEDDFVTKQEILDAKRLGNLQYFKLNLNFKANEKENNAWIAFPECLEKIFQHIDDPVMKFCQLATTHSKNEVAMILGVISFFIAKIVQGTYNF